MTNVKATQLATCITLTHAEFENVVTNIWGNTHQPDYCGDRVGITAYKRDVPKQEMLDKLKDYFVVNAVTSVFFLSDRPRCVWIEYTR